MPPFRLTRRHALLSPLALLAPGVVEAEEQAASDISWPTDEWEVSTPQETGMRAELLTQVPAQMQIQTPLLTGMVVVKDGRIALEQYQNGYTARDPFHVWSVSKSITSIAVGLALQEELLPSLDLTLGELIPERIPMNVDPRVYGITVEQLLTMTAGWAWDSRVNFARTAETDDLDQMLTRPMACDPGACFEYDSGCSNLLSYIVQTLSGELMADYLQPRLFDPLGIGRPEWIVTEDGANRGGGGAYLTLREMAKIGLLYAHTGTWAGEEIINKRWVRRSTTARSTGSGFLSGVNIGTGPYGYHWWVAEKQGVDGFAALGYGGQVIYVAPDLGLVVTTGYAGADGTRPDLQQPVWPLIEQFVLPAAMGQ